jgi:AcrR family transcriptional regulator
MNPKSHLHNAAAASTGRWCGPMADHELTAVATHHEPVLAASRRVASRGRPPGSGVTYDARVDEGGDSSRRRYDSPVRRLRAAASRARIIAGAAELARELPSWDWGSLTIQAVADQAGVSRRTVYRHFASEAVLHGALADRLLDEAGVSYEGLTLDHLPEVTGRVFSAVAKFAATPWAVVPAAFPALDADRLDALRSAVDAEVPDWADADRAMAAAALDIVWSVASYEILLRDWKLPPVDAVRVQRWLHELVTGALRAGEKPLQPSGRKGRGRHPPKRTNP